MNSNSTTAPPAARPHRLRRRSVVRGVLLGGTIPTLGAQAGCASGESTRGAAPVTSTTSRPERARAADDSARVLVVYFSRAGENYFYGDRIDLDVGNTEVLAGTISSHLRRAGVEHDTYRIEAADPYPVDYDETVERNVKEQDRQARPQIANPLESIAGYDTVLIGSPIWNVRPPRIMMTFAEGRDFTGKDVFPFVTHAMSGLGDADRDYSSACRGAAIGEGLAIRGEVVRDQGPSESKRWLATIGLT
jgi:flavodoxin